MDHRSYNYLGMQGAGRFPNLFLNLDRCYDTSSVEPVGSQRYEVNLSHLFLGFAEFDREHRPKWMDDNLLLQGYDMIINISLHYY